MILFTGMHRSGTSAVSNLACFRGGKLLLDDPRWAVNDPLHALDSNVFLSQVDKHDAFKVPRWAPFAPALLERFPQMRVVWVLRNPLDIWDSIAERAQQYPGTTMLRFPEFRPHLGSPIADFVAAFARYLAALRVIAELSPERVAVVVYDDFFRDRVGGITRLCEEFLHWRAERPIESLVHIQFAPIRHKVGPIGGPNRYAANPKVRHTSELLSSMREYSSTLMMILGSGAWMFRRDAV